MDILVVPKKMKLIKNQYQKKKKTRLKRAGIS